MTSTIWRFLFWPSILLFVLIALFGLLRWYLELELDAFSLAAFDLRFVVLAISFHALALLVSTSTWHLNLQKHGIRKLSPLQSLAMTGLGTLGKYTPGKVWGLLARGAAVQRLSGSTQTAATSALTEQVALLHSGGVLALLCLLRSTDNGWPLLLLTALGGILSSHAAANAGPLIWALFSRFDRRGRLQNINPDINFRAAYPTVFLGLLGMWLAAAAVLWASIHAIGTATPPNFSEATLITLLSYIGGFASFFSPAGLGVRDGIMAAMLTPHIGIAPALYVSLLHRLITAAFDLLLGLLSLVFLDKNSIPYED